MYLEEKKKVLTIPSVSNFNSFLAFQIYSKIYIFPHSKITARLVFQGIKLFKMWLEYLAKNWLQNNRMYNYFETDRVASKTKTIYNFGRRSNKHHRRGGSIYALHWLFRLYASTVPQEGDKVWACQTLRHTTEEIIGTSGSFPFSPSHSSRSQLALSKKSDYITHQWYSFFNQHQWYSWT